MPIVLYRFVVLCVLSSLISAVICGRKGNFRRRGCHPPQEEHEDGQPPVDDFAFRVAPNGDVMILEGDDPRKSASIVIPQPYPRGCSGMQVFRITTNEPVEFALDSEALGFDLSCFSHTSQSIPSAICPEKPDYSLTLTFIDVASETVLVHVPVEQLLNGSLRELILQRTSLTSAKLTYTQLSASECPSYLVVGATVARIDGMQEEELTASAPLISRTDPTVITESVDARFYLASTEAGLALDTASVEAKFVVSGKPCSALDNDAEAPSAYGATDFCADRGEVFVSAALPHSGPYTICIKDQGSKKHIPVAGITVFGGNPAFFKVRGLQLSMMPLVVTFFGNNLDSTVDTVKFIDYFSSCGDSDAKPLQVAKQTPLAGAGGLLDFISEGRTFTVVVFKEAVSARVCYKTGDSERFVEVPLFDNLDSTAQAYVTSTPADESQQSSTEGSSVPSDDRSSSTADEASGWGGSFEGGKHGSSDDGSDGKESDNDEQQDHSDGNDDQNPRAACLRAPKAFVDAFGKSAVLVTFAHGNAPIMARFAETVARILCVNASFVVVTLQHEAPAALVAIECDVSCNSHERLATLLWLFQSSRSGNVPGSADPAATIGGRSIITMEAAPAAGLVVGPGVSQMDLGHTILVASVGAAAGVAATIIAVVCCFVKRCCCFRHRRRVGPEDERPRNGSDHPHGPTAATFECGAKKAVTSALERGEEDACEVVVIGVVVEKRHEDGPATVVEGSAVPPKEMTAMDSR
jgi:hypothetical protein